ncbi:TIGR00366 family protein [Nocardia alni]|uniref:TIGR00366 family protein n=1 Tax=Nocardia alni TaxID=2815723 RepID=UPI001C22BFD2|nr:TIGR00366 family protein [Nocardia alni]
MRRFTDTCVRYVERVMPDPYILAVVLTIITAVAALAAVSHATPSGAARAWYEGVWGQNNIFAFALEMVLILVSGHALADAPLIRRGLDRLAALPNTQIQAAVLVFLVAAVCTFLNWGLGLVTGALLARRIAQRVNEAGTGEPSEGPQSDTAAPSDLTGLHFGYLIASAYAGFITCNSGLSASVALANTDPKSPLDVVFTATHHTLGLWRQVGQPANLVPTIVLVAVIPFVLRRIAPVEALAPDPALFEESAAQVEERTGLAGAAERFRPLTWVIVAAGAYAFSLHHFSLDVGSMVMLFTLAGMLLHGNPIRYVRSFVAAARTVGPMVLQFPLYGGIIGLLGYAPSKDVHSLAVLIADGIVSGATVMTLPFLNFLASLVITLFVPSAGGHWGVQGPVAVHTALALHQSSPGYLAKLSMSVAAGESVTNMIQPFWLLPVLALAKLPLRQVMGYTVVIFLLGLVAYGASFLLIPAV